MIYFSENPSWLQSRLLKESFFCKFDLINIDNDEIKFIKSSKDKDLILFIPIYGEEELGETWLDFFYKLSNNKKNIGKSLYLFFLEYMIFWLITILQLLNR